MKSRFLFPAFTTALCSLGLLFSSVYAADAMIGKTYVIYRDAPVMSVMRAPTPRRLPPLPPLPNMPVPVRSSFLLQETAYRTRVVQLAQAQLGLDKTTNRDYVNQTFSLGQDEPWCADFVSTILEWAGGSPWGHQGMVKSIYDWAQSNQRLTLNPQPGDIVVFGTAGPAAAVANVYHIAILETLNPDGSISTVGGNEGQHSMASLAPDFAGRVQRTTYPFGDARIVGFIRAI